MKKAILELNQQEIKEVCGGSLTSEGIKAIILAGSPMVGFILGMGLFISFTKPKAAVTD